MNDIDIAGKYQRKAQSSTDKGLEFDLSFVQFKRLKLAKKCAYTGIELTRKRDGTPIRSTDATLERIDAGVGYTAANTVSVCHAANKIKSVWENPQNILTPELVQRILDSIAV